ncbi:MAG: SPFH domain-containing protein [Chloroflexi bacterium]|jgi:membrane protease subunit (stomatin/prohibitin family)|nr:SPFH domain-containing protein [Chloroflexota bacterium]
MARILDVIEYPDAAPNEIVHRIPERGSGDFRIGSQLIVREGQMAVFFRDGKALDTFGPGRHTITTANIPLLVNLVRRVFSGDTPFTAEVYFVNMRDFIDQRWGTPEPVTLRDEVLRMVRLRAHGTFSMAVADPQLFVGQVVGTRGYYATQDIVGFLRGMIISRLTDMIGENIKSLFDLPAMFDEISAATRIKLHDEFAALGLDLKRLFVISVSPTEETSKAIDEAASMGAIGNMDAYVKFKAAQAVGDAAQQPGGAVGDTAQMSMGLATGMAAAQAIAGAFTQPQQQAPAAAQPAAGPADPVQALQTLKQLLDNGLITQEEYDAKRADILGRL